MKDKNIQELINLYHSGKLNIVEKKVTELIKKNPKMVLFYFPIFFRLVKKFIVVVHKKFNLQFSAKKTIKSKHKVMTKNKNYIIFHG